MELFVKNMVSNRCKMLVKSELEKLGLHYIIVELGEVEIKERLSVKQRNLLNASLKKLGLELIADKKIILIEKIKIIIIKLIHYSEVHLKINLSDYLSEKLNSELLIWE